MSAPDEIWKCQDGRLIAVGDMTEAHAKNALRMILRNRRKRAALQVDLNKLEDHWADLYEEDRKWGSD
jgi:chemotaxis regulatin CheY-phosphate phosphatase CheZ